MGEPSLKAARQVICSFSAASLTKRLREVSLRSPHRAPQHTNGRAQDMSKAWADYSALYGKLEDVKAEAGGVVDKRRAGLKRKISQAQVREAGPLLCSFGAGASTWWCSCAALPAAVPVVCQRLQHPPTRLPVCLPTDRDWRLDG